MSEATPGRQSEDATSSLSAPSHEDKLCDAGAIDNSSTRQVFSSENACVASDQECPAICNTNTECAVEDVVESRDFSNFEESSRALLQRKQPLMELVNSEEGYVRRLRMVKDCYMPVISAARNPASVPSSDSSAVPALPASVSNTSSRELTQTASHPPPVPDDLAARWRIIWGNWIQLCEWHSTFLEKLMNLVEREPDKIPKLFIDSRSRLRSIYSKYCENHRKAALIAEQYRDYFEELRVYLNDKEDVVSYLMQPVQRIMRYQLPMAEIVKYTERAGSPDLALWKKALDIMKEIPKDTQLILEVSRMSHVLSCYRAFSVRIGHCYPRMQLLNLPVIYRSPKRDPLRDTIPVLCYCVWMISLVSSLSFRHAGSCFTFYVSLLAPTTNRSVP
ncbi:Triple functional domain protein [Paragonimus heterotremus]|uniref:Triple functional domain protein n=1 Tax=Paragonimus heterotremus TaxID=100268 RepID=A0A8J4WTC6_9TREM|nr:Triple functional domain protein [Paragonimus heterotremus]